MSKRGLGCVAVVLSVLIPGVSGAQVSGSSGTQSTGAQGAGNQRVDAPDASEGLGLRMGNLELHPSIAGEIGYDSNYFLRSSKTADPGQPPISNGGPVGSGVLQITPTLTLNTLGEKRKAVLTDTDAQPSAPPAIGFRGGITAKYREFLNPDMSDQRNVGGAVDARIDVLPQRPWSGSLGGSFIRTILPTFTGNPDLAFNRLDLALGGDIVWNPGGGTLEWKVGYDLRLAMFEQSVAQPYTNMTNEVYMLGRWKFRPRTSLVYDGSVRWTHYSDVSGAAASLHDSTPVRARFGMTGLITPRFAVKALVGYGASFYDASVDAHTQQFDSVIGEIEARFFLSPAAATEDITSSGSTLSIGGNRDFANSFLGDFVTTDRAYVKLSQSFGRRVSVSADAGVAAMEYPDIYYQAKAVGKTGAPQLVQNSFTDIRPDVSIAGEYRFTSTFAITATGSFSQNISNATLPGTPTATGVKTIYDLSWQRITGFAGLRWFM